MSFTDVMYGGLGQVNNTFQNNLAANQAAMQQQAMLQANSLAMGQQNQQVVDNLYGPQGFGGQTAQYAGAGAAYGRNVGEPMSSVFDTGTTPYNDYGNPALGAGQPNYFSGATPVGTLTGGQANDPASMSYLNANPDVAQSGLSAYDHYKQFGEGEGRYSYGVENLGGDAPKPMDWGNYFSGVTAPHAGGQGGGWEAEYLLANPDVAAAAEKAGGDVNAFADQHYLNSGQAEGRRVFDANAYLQENPDVAASGMNPFVHFNQYGRGEGRAEPMSGVFDPETYRSLNPDIGAMDAFKHWQQYGQNEGRVGGFAPSNDAFRNAYAAMPQGGEGGSTDPAITQRLMAQRADYAAKIRDDPNLSLKLAARLYSEDQNDPSTRQAILETMMNRYTATGQDPLNPGYYPTNPKAYNEALNKLSNNSDLLNQVYQEMERPFGGSNISNYATNWASGDIATNDLKYSTGTWLSPTGEQFYRKDLPTIDPSTGQSWAGLGNVNKNLLWFDSVTGSPPR